MDGVKRILPSGDVSGVKDRVELEKAFDDNSITVVELTGTYWINGPLTCQPKTITGLGQPIHTAWPSEVYTGARIRCVGTWTKTNYALTLLGAVIHNAWIGVAWKCRGVRQSSRYAMESASNLFIDSPSQIGYDLVDNWGSRLAGIFILRPRGIAMRLHRANSLQIDTLRINHGYLFRNVNPALNEVTWRTACEFGQAAAEAIPGYATDWPSPDDQTVKDMYGNIVATPVEDRAALVVGSQEHSIDLVTFRNVLFEPIHAGEYPTVVLRGTNLTFDTVRFEGGYHRDTLFQVANTQPVGPNHWRAVNNQIRNAFVVAVNTDWARPAYVARAVNSSHNLVLDGITAKHYLKSAILACDGGTHYAPSVRNVYKSPGVQDIVALNGASIQANVI